MNCSGGVGGTPVQYALRFYQFSWTSRSTTSAQTVFDPAVTSVSVGGYSISQAFDPSATVDANGKVWLAFECVASNGSATFSSSCVAPLLSDNTLDTAARYVRISPNDGSANYRSIYDIAIIR